MVLREQELGRDTDPDPGHPGDPGGTDDSDLSQDAELGIEFRELQSHLSELPGIGTSATTQESQTESPGRDPSEIEPRWRRGRQRRRRGWRIVLDESRESGTLGCIPERRSRSSRRRGRPPESGLGREGSERIHDLVPWLGALDPADRRASTDDPGSESGSGSSAPRMSPGIGDPAWTAEQCGFDRSRDRIGSLRSRGCESISPTTERACREIRIETGLSEDAR